MIRILFNTAFLIVCLVFSAGFVQAAENDDILMLQDHTGASLQVKAPFTRIISLYGAHTDNLRNLGLDEEIIGVSPSDHWQGKAVFSYHDGLEKFLAYKPDLVFTRPMINHGYPRLIEGLEKAGIAVASFQPSTVDEMFEYWVSLGMLTGKTAEAREMVSRFKEEIARIRKISDALPDKKRVYFEAIHDRMRTFTPGSMAIYALEAAGGVNAAADATSVRGTNIAYYGKERILSKASEIDVFLSQDGAMNQPTLSMIINEPGFEIIKAVREGQVYIVEERLVSRPTAALLDGVRIIGEILYPEAFGKGGVQ